MTLNFHPARFFSPGERVAVAVSGGADSVALLALLLEARDALGIVVCVAHYNHRLRGAESDADAAFVASLPSKHQLDYYVAEAEAEHDRNIEAAARRDRYAFFATLPVTKVATAHTADDQAETVLTRLLRGSGSAGLSGILPTRDRIVRPLLDVRRVDLRAYAVAQQLEWREDASNLDPRFLRNRIRAELIPLLERDYNPAIVDTLARAAEVARGDEADLQRETHELANRLLAPGPPWKLKLPDFVQLSEGRQRRLLRLAIEFARGDLRRIDFHHVERVRRQALEYCGESKRLELPGVTIELRGNCILIGV